METPPPSELLQFLEPYDPSIRELALSLRKVVLNEMGACHENIYDAYNAVAVGYGPTDRLKDGICHIAVYSHHVNLGFNRGALLDDPKGVMRGTGKWIRHITIKTNADLVVPEIRRLLRAAMKHAGYAMKRRRHAGAVTSVVKAIYPTKRRPSREG